MRTIRHLLAAALFAAIGTAALSAQDQDQDQDQDVVRQGRFYDGPHAPGHKVSGEARVVQGADGGYEIQLSDFVSDAGPDVYIILSTAERPTKDAHVKGSTWVPVGKRLALTGDQSYPVPASVAIDDFNSVGIWCKRYSVLFGAAALE